MSKVRSFEDLLVWQKARKFTCDIYLITNNSLFKKDLSLKDQIRRASVSIISNISEGFESRTTKLFVDYLGRAKASAGEARAQLYIALDCGYINDESFNKLLKDVKEKSKMIKGLMDYLEKYPHSSRTKEVITTYEFD